MPHIQIDISQNLRNEQKKIICKHVAEIFSTVMKTGKDHIAISIREFDQDNLYLGQVTDISDGIVLMNIDLRSGRTIQQRKKLKSELMDALSQITLIPIEGMYITFTEHQGKDFHLSNRNLDDWSTTDL
tara:strand:- start:44 stop:430 length:387 start_codon:yes stop_codon:yes gene_type:complete